MNYFRIIFPLSLLFLLLTLTSCPEENENLLNPPPVAETVKTRFLNFAGDKQPRQLALGDNTFLPETQYGESSDAISPPLDSLFVKVLKNGQIEYKKEMMLKFSRKMTYNFVALPSAPGDSLDRVVDTLIYFTNSISIPNNTDQTYIKVINTIPDTTMTFSLKLGCPNGASVATNLNFRQITSSTGIRSGLLPFSLIKHTGMESYNIGLFQPLDTLKAKGQYTFFIMKDQSGEIKLKLLDEMFLGKDGFRDVPEVEERITNIRVINFSGSSIDVVKAPADQVVQDLVPGRIDAYKAIPACASTNLDSVVITGTGGTGSVATTSFEVLERYSVLVFDTKDSAGNVQSAGTTIIAEPLFQNPDLSGKALVRVVHAGIDLGGITLSLGAREAPVETQNGFTSGEVLANAISYGEISEPVILSAGAAPLTLFTAGTPGKLLFASLTNLEPQKSYLIVITEDNDGKPRISLITEEQQSTEIKYLNEGSIVQVINAQPAFEKIQLNFDNKINNATLYYTSSLATVIQPGNHSIKLSDGKSENFSTQLGQETILIITGNKIETDILTLTGPKIESALNNYHRRFINVSRDINNLFVKRFLADESFIAGPIKYGEASDYDLINRPNKVSYIFFDDPQDTVFIHRAEDISLTYGKTYSVIFSGTEESGKYSIIIHQQY